MDRTANLNISIVVPAYRNIEEVLICLNSLQASAVDLPHTQWLVQDDFSPNLDMRAVIPRCVASVDRNERNLGFSGNANRGAARATGDIIAIVNQDIVADGNLSIGWDNVIRDAFVDESVGIVAPRLVFPDGKIQSAGGNYDNRLQPYHRCLGYSDLSNWEVNTPESVSWATGAFICVRRSVFEQVGGFDEAFVSYWEDVDLNERVKTLGYKVWYEPRTTFIHRVGTTGGSPHFAAGAQLFKQRYVDTRRIKADVNATMERWW